MQRALHDKAGRWRRDARSHDRFGDLTAEEIDRGFGPLGYPVWLGVVTPPASRSRASDPTPCDDGVKEIVGEGHPFDEGQPAIHPAAYQLTK